MLTKSAAFFKGRLIHWIQSRNADRSQPFHMRTCSNHFCIQHRDNKRIYDMHFATRFAQP